MRYERRVAKETQTGTYDSTATSAETLQPFVFVVLQANKLGARAVRINLRGVERLSIGRGDKRGVQLNDNRVKLSLDDERISGDHCELISHAQGVELSDLGSKNGSRVDGQNVTSIWLDDGALIELGRTFLIFKKLKAPNDIGRVLEVEPFAAEAGLATLNPGLERHLDDFRSIAGSKIAVLVRGETGTGKELAASALHALSGRTGPFVPVNCGAMPASLAASELFGYRKGAFSGAVDDRPGLVRTADKGTLFLDEVGDLPPDVQASLLRVLQEGEVLPLGAAKAVAADVRVVAATHRDLEAMVASGEFRQDLFSRLSGFTLRLPPLRARREDLGLMLAAIGKRKLGREVALRSSSARRLFAAPFTRNVRELEQAMVVASTLSADEPLDLTLAGGTDAATEQAGDADLKARLEAALKAHDGNISKVAKEMGKARMQIHRWMKRFGLEPSAKEKD